MAINIDEENIILGKMRYKIPTFTDNTISASVLN